MPDSAASDKKRLQSEYVAGGYHAGLAAVRSVLPQYVDDISRRFGREVYAEMVQDSTVESALSTRKLAVLADGIRVSPAFDAPTGRAPAIGDVKRAEQSSVLADFVERCLENCDQDITEIADALLDGLQFGSRVSEITLRPGIGQDAGRLVLGKVKPKSVDDVAFVVDQFLNVQGFQYRRPGFNGITGGIAGDEWVDFIPRHKFVVFSHGAQDGDPRGNSVLRAAYTPWFIKTQVVPEFFKFLRQFASPSIIGKTPTPEVNAAASGDQTKYNDLGEPVYTSEGDPVIVTAEQVLLDRLLAWVNAYAIAVPGGTEIDFLQSTGNGEAFLSACDWFDRQINAAILGTDGMTMSAKNDSKSSKEVGQDVVGLRVSADRRALGRAMTRDIARLLVRVNFGDDALNLCPVISATAVESQDWAEEVKAVASLTSSGYLHESQFPEIDERLGLPERDMDAIRAEREESRMMNNLINGHRSTLIDPLGGEDVDPVN